MGRCGLGARRFAACTLIQAPRCKQPRGVARVCCASPLRQACLRTPRLHAAAALRCRPWAAQPGCASAPPAPRVARAPVRQAHVHVLKAVVPRLLVRAHQVDHNVGTRHRLADGLLAEVKVAQGHHHAQVAHGPQVLHVQVVAAVRQHQLRPHLAKSLRHVAPQEAGAAKDGGRHAVHLRARSAVVLRLARCGWHEGPSAQAEGGTVPAARLQRRAAKHGPGGRSPSTGCLEHQGGQTLFQHIHARCQPARTPTRRPCRLYSIRPGRATHRRAPAVSRPQRIVLDSELAVVPHAGGCCRCRRAQQRGAGSALGGLRRRHRHCAAAAARRPVRRLLQHTTRRLAALTCGLLLQQRPQLQRQAGQLLLHVARLALLPGPCPTRQPQIWEPMRRLIRLRAAACPPGASGSRFSHNWPPSLLGSAARRLCVAATGCAHGMRRSAQG